LKEKRFTMSSLKRFIASIFLIAVIAPFCYGDDNGYITITNPFIKKAPIAVPVLKCMSASKNEARLSDQMSKTLSAMLDYTGYFKIIDRAAFLEEPAVKGVDETKINFRNWTTIGAEMLVTGSILEANGTLIIDLYLFDTSRERKLVVKRYKCTDKGIRDVAKRFGTEIIRRFSGSEGLFNSRIAFLSTGTGNKEVYTCDFDGFGVKQETRVKSITLSPAWYHDGSMIAFTSYQKGQPDIYIKNLATGKIRCLVDERGSNITPAWIPGKTDLVASLSFEGSQGIYLLTLDGKIRNRITEKWSDGGIDVSPSFSPDGTNMAYVSKMSGTPQIFIKNLGSGIAKRLTYQGKYNTTPAWSPTGQKLAYTGLSESKFDIYVIEIAGGDPIQLTRNAGDNEAPSWSPDGSMIAFSSTREGRCRVYVMTAYGTDQRRILNLPGEQSNPKWSANILNK
jgi:TolB protein